MTYIFEILSANPKIAAFIIPLRKWRKCFQKIYFLQGNSSCALSEGDTQQRLDQSKMTIAEANRTTQQVQEVITPMANNLNNWSQNLQSFDSSTFNTAVNSARDAGRTNTEIH